VALSADGKRVLTGSGDKTAILWDAATGKQQQVFEGHVSYVFDVALSADGAKVLTGSHDGTAVLWEAATGKKLQTFLGYGSAVSGVALSANGKLVATGSGDKTAILWEAATGKKLKTFQGHTSDVTSVALSADGKKLVTGSYDKSAILWDTATGKKLQTFRTPPVPQPKDRITEMAERLAALPAALLKEKKTDAELVDAIYLATFMKLPNAMQKENAKNFLKKHPINKQVACEDMIWACMNTKEFAHLHGFTLAELMELSDKVMKGKK
jgi:WD40 repeat protein